MTITEQIRQAIRDCGMSRYRLSRESGVSESTLSKFMAGKGMRCDVIDRLAPVLGLKITTTAKTPRTPRTIRKTTQPKTRRIKAKQKGGS